MYIRMYVCMYTHTQTHKHTHTHALLLKFEINKFQILAPCFWPWVKPAVGGFKEWVKKWFKEWVKEWVK